MKKYIVRLVDNTDDIEDWLFSLVEDEVKDDLTLANATAENIEWLDLSFDLTDEDKKYLESEEKKCTTWDWKTATDYAKRMIDYIKEKHSDELTSDDEETLNDYYQDEVYDPDLEYDTQKQYADRLKGDLISTYDDLVALVDDTYDYDFIDEQEEKARKEYENNDIEIYKHSNYSHSTSPGDFVSFYITINAEIEDTNNISDDYDLRLCDGHNNNHKNTYEINLMDYIDYDKDKKDFVIVNKEKLLEEAKKDIIDMIGQALNDIS